MYFQMVEGTSTISTLEDRLSRMLYRNIPEKYVELQKQREMGDMVLLDASF
jgi:hypothetical protein